MKRFALTTLGLTGAFLWAGEALADEYGRDGMRGYYHDGFMGFHGGPMMGWMGPIMMIAFLVVIGVVVWAVINAASGRAEHHHKVGSSALDVLRERYARGEIDHDEFEERRKRLE